MQFLKILNSFGIFPEGVIHVGANSGQEVEDYHRHGFTTAIFVEPIPKEFAELRAKTATRPDYVAENALCSERAGETMRFNIASNSGQSSSIFALGNHAVLHPSVKYVDAIELVTTTVDDIIERHGAAGKVPLIVLDVQGAELLVLKGARKSLGDVSAVYCEVADVALYENSCTWHEIADFLAPFDFKLKNLIIKHHNWGMALFVREGAYVSALRRVPALEGGINLALDRPARQSSVWQDDARFANAGRAVNGRPDGSFAFHTEKEKGPWWEVDLLEEQPIDQVAVYNRMDGARSRAFNFLLKIAGEDRVFTTVHR